MNFQARFAEKLRWRLKTIEHNFRQSRLTTKETVEANTEHGKIRGVKKLSIYNQPYYNFEGIPYAQPPIGNLRYKAPQKPTPWTGVRDCMKARDKSVQLSFIYNKPEGSEDCLYLNVYTNNLTPSKPRPVMVFIHGGGFIFGEANNQWYGPDYFIEKDVILVTIQYRLGALGFLSMNSPELEVPGNAGLKDQVMALKWVKNNVERFGGDPNCITVFGQSAGGASTHYMMLTEQTRNLFHRGILMSGNAICPWAITDAASRVERLASLAGYKGKNNEKDMFEFFKQVNAYDLMAVEHKALSAKDRRDNVMFPFGPVIEPYKTEQCVMPESPLEMLKNAWGNNLPIMLGNTSQEGLLWKSEIDLNPQAIDVMNDCVSFVPSELADNERTSAEVKRLGQILRKTHVAGDKPTVEDYMDFNSYVCFWWPTHRLIQKRFEQGLTAPMYLYRYDFDSEELTNPYRIMRYGRGVKGVSHSDELSFLFGNILANPMPKQSREYQAIEKTVGIWTQFAKTGNPNSASIVGMDKLNWEPIKDAKATYKCLNISDNLEFIDLPEMEKSKVWETLYNKRRELF